MAIAVNSGDTFLYGVDILQPIAGCSLSNACPGDVFICPMAPDGALGTPVNGTNRCPQYYPLQLTASDTKTILTPTALNVLANGQYLYVTAYNAALTPKVGYLFVFATNADGTLTAVPAGSGGQIPLTLGVQPVAMASDSGSAYLYVVDKLQNSLATYAIQSGGIPTWQSAASTGSQPSGLTLSGTNLLYVSNSLDSTVTGYNISSGNLTNFGTYATSTNPIAIAGDPRELGFVYTVNFLGNSLSGYQINPATGALINTKNSPYQSTPQPTAIAGIPHNGNTH